jgi:hypothetical protein
MFFWKYKRVLLAVCAIFILGCRGTIPSFVAPDFDKRCVRLIALMPVDNKTKDEKAAVILRKDLLEELYFKGYPKIPLDVIDGKINEINEGNFVAKGKRVPPDVIGEALGIDAVMYCTLTEWGVSLRYLYAPTTVAASFELLSAKTGETLWRSNQKVVERDYDITQKRLEMKSHESYEKAVREVLDKAMETFPDGPDCLGDPSSTKGVKDILIRLKNSVK